MIQSIPLNKLRVSPRNVRRSSDEQADLQLKADIEARGLLQNLVVTSLARPRGCFAVEGGGRRLRALQSLADEGKLDKRHQVCCLVLDGDVSIAREAGLAENFQRLSMNPADECLAFNQLVEEGCDPERIARRFGLTRRFVDGRLRLASLAPVVFEALGAGEIGLEVAKAYAATPDQERQTQVFEQVGRSYGAAHPDSIRRMMTQATAAADDRRALFVGEAPYLAAGGRIERDLFSDVEGVRWLDIGLLERLALDKLQRMAVEKAAEMGLAWVKPSLERWIGYPETEGLTRLATETPPLDEAGAELVEQLEAQAEAIALELEDESLPDDMREAAEARIRELGERIEAITDRPPIVDEAFKDRAGAFLLIDPRGQARLDHGRFVEPASDDVNANPACEVGSQLADDDSRPAKAAGLSQRLVDELAIQRRDVLAVHVAADTRVALDLATFLMADRRPALCEKSGSSLSAMPPASPISGFKSPGAAAVIAFEEADRGLDRSWCAADTRAERFDAFRALPDAARAAWLGHSVARTLEASLNRGGPRSCAFHDHLGSLLGIEVAQWWRPTAANYFDRVPKSIALAALEEVGGPSLAAQHSKSKKADLAEACERIFAGDFIAEAEVKARALAWVPEAMRFRSAARAANGDCPWDEPAGPGAEAPGPECDADAKPAELEEAA